MSIVYGVTEQGFVAKPLDVIKRELESALLGGVLGQSAGTEPDGSIPARSVAGQIIGIMTDGLAAQWDLQQAVYASFDPSAAEDAALDAVCAITGTLREMPFASLVTATCTGAPGTLLEAGRAATVEGTGSRFLSLAAATIAALDAWQGSTDYEIGERVTSAGNIYQCTVAGTSAASGGPSGTGSAIAEGPSTPQLTWEFVGIGTGAIDVLFQADAVGRISATRGTLTTIATPIDGWKSITNLADAALGAAREADPDLRVRREDELRASGLAAADAIRAHVLAVGAGEPGGVTACIVFENDTDEAVDGLPPHSVEVLVQCGDDPAMGQRVAQAIWEAVGAGIATTGNVTPPNTVTDAGGQAQTVHWSRPVQVPVAIAVAVTYDSTTNKLTNNAAGKAAVRGAIAAAGEGYSIGLDVWAAALLPAVFGVGGVLNAEVLVSGGTHVEIGKREIARFPAVADIAVALTPGTP